MRLGSAKIGGMNSPATTHVVLRCDATPTIGVGHLVRCLALGEELMSRGCTVTLVGELSNIGWLQDLVAERGISVIAPEAEPVDVADQVRRLGAAAVVVDGYQLDHGLGTALRHEGLVTLAMVDAEFGAAQEADLYVDQNLGSRPRVDLPEGSDALAGIEYSLFRDSVLSRRRELPAPSREPVRVLAVFGGTDPYDAAPVLLPVLLATGVPMHVTVIAARPETRVALEALPHGPDQIVDVVDPQPDLAALAVQCDVAVSASGSSVWELLCLGVPTGVVCVADNQQPGYTMTVGSGVVAPLGILDDLKTRPEARVAAAGQLQPLLTDPARRTDLAEHGQKLVDGAGRIRVADALLARVTAAGSHNG